MNLQMNQARDWSAARARVVRPQGKINLNAGTLSPTPLPVLEAVTTLRRQMAADPSDFLWRRSGPLIERARTRLAQYLNAQPANLLLLPNATYAINLVIHSLRLPTGSHILTTDHEYGAMMFAWRRAAERQGWVVRQLELPFQTEDPAAIVETFARSIDGDTRGIYFSHVTTTTGLVLPARQICALARQRGVLSIVDGAHAPGMIPLDLDGLGADYYAGNCHKWLMAPATAGFLHVSPGHKAELTSLVTSWGHEYDRAQPEAPSILGCSGWQFEHEFHGTVDRCPQMVLPEALDFRAELGGEEALAARVRQLVEYARQRLLEGGFACATPLSRDLSGALVAFDYPCADPVAARDRLYHEHHIECPVTVASGRTFLRVSCAWFNTTEEIDRLAEAVAGARGGADFA